MNLKSILTVLFASLLLAVPSLAQIKSGRAIQIVIQGVPSEERARIDGMYPVGESGMINMPFIGEVRAAGMRPEDLQKVLQNLYKSHEIYSNPTIQVIASDTTAIDEQVVHVGGQVRKTGPVKYHDGLTLYQAIQAAGGNTEFGSLYRVKLYRGGQARQYDVMQNQFKHIPLKPNDTIEVPQKSWNGR